MNSVPVMNVGVAAREKCIMKRPAAQAEQGQSLVIFTLLLFALMGMLALTLDGGNGFLQRRLAQNAADAGALAGARELCITGDRDQAIYRALEYAIDRNGALEAEVTVDTGIVTVNTMISVPTTFGNVLGQPELTAHATASAGCFAPSGGINVLPVAWSCRLGEETADPGICDVDYDKTYIIMDSESGSTDHCAPSGAIDCDFDDDGRNDMFVGGDRSWLDLDGATNYSCGGACELKDWVENGFNSEIIYHTWVPEQSGVANDIFHTAEDTYDVGGPKYGEVVILPVFDKACRGDPDTEEESGCEWHDGDQYAGGEACASGQWCYHIISFSAFVITCVSDTPGAANSCPAKDEAIGVPGSGIENNTRTIEGYFVEGFVPGLSGRPSDGVDAGAYTLYLTQ